MKHIALKHLIVIRRGAGTIDSDFTRALCAVLIDTGYRDLGIKSETDGAPSFPLFLVIIVLSQSAEMSNCENIGVSLPEHYSLGRLTQSATLVSGTHIEHPAVL